MHMKNTESTKDNKPERKKGSLRVVASALGATAVWLVMSHSVDRVATISAYETVVSDERISKEVRDEYQQATDEIWDGLMWPTVVLSGTLVAASGALLIAGSRRDKMDTEAS